MEIHIGNRITEAELLNKEDNLVRLSIDGKEYEVDITMLQDGVYSILQDGKSYNAELSYSEDRKNYTVNTAFSSHDIQIDRNKTQCAQNLQTISMARVIKYNSKIYRYCKV